jgi:CPA1 family monovalent cation:H+ antiporter
LSSLTQLDVIYNILIIVALVTLITWRLRFPVTLGLIIAGILSSFSTRIMMPNISTELFLEVLLPPIIFQEALHLNVDDLVKEIDTIFTFSIIGTLLMQGLITLLTTTFFGFTFIEGLLFGTLLAPTDPVAVIRTFHSLNVDKRFEIIVSGESLFNDGVAVVFFITLLSVITKGTITIIDVGEIVIVTIFGGILIGYLVGYLIHALFCWTDDKFFQILVSLMTCFGTFRIAEELGASGILATVTAGLILNYRLRRLGGLGAECYEMLETLWELIGFLASSLAFIFIGTHLDRGLFISFLPTSIAIFLAIVIFRFITLELLTKSLEKTCAKSFSRGWKDALLWSGMKGAISIVLVLGISGLVSKSNLLTTFTFGVVILSNIIQGMTMGSIIQERDVKCVDTFIEEDIHNFSEKYYPAGYNKNAHKYTKLFFLLPEYIASDTKYGSIISNRIMNLIEELNLDAVEEIPITTIGWINTTLAKATGVLFAVLNWVNSFVMTAELDMFYSLSFSDFFDNIAREFNQKSEDV